MNVKITVRANGAERHATVPPMKRLLDVLRDDLGLTGTKEGCGEGECGACSVLLDGEVVNSCLVAACQADGTEITTVEGLAPESGPLSAIQEAFWEHGGAQCGICTPGMLIASADLLSKDPRPSEARVREALSGNLCRCTGYVKIVESVISASGANRRSLASGAAGNALIAASRTRKPAKKKPSKKSRKGARR